MTTMRFSVPWYVADLDAHPEPVAGWHRVVVLAGSESIGTVRRRWPDAAAVSALRRPGDLDPLVRALLANPQIRVLVWDGFGSLGGSEALDALLRWYHQGWLGDLSDELRQLASDTGQRLADIARVGVEMCGSAALVRDRIVALAEIVNDRDGGAILPPPPRPDPAASASHRDPDERVAGDTVTHPDADRLRKVSAAAEVMIEGARAGTGAFSVAAVPAYADKTRRARDCWAMVGKVLCNDMGEDAFLDLAKELLLTYARGPRQGSEA